MRRLTRRRQAVGQIADPLDDVVGLRRIDDVVRAKLRGPLQPPFAGVECDDARPHLGRKQGRRQPDRTLPEHRERLIAAKSEPP